MPPVFVYNCEASEKWITLRDSRGKLQLSSSRLGRYDESRFRTSERTKKKVRQWRMAIFLKTGFMAR